MNDERLMKIIVAPLVSEKSAMAADAGRQFTFKVVPDATKREIGRAVEKMFDVKVDQVRVINVKGKKKRFGALMGKRKDWRKAIVRLQEGHDIDFAGLAG
jgi:large subunit ribosomal protein L23